MHVLLTASTLTGLDYSTLFAAASTELLAILPPVVLVGVGVMVAIWSIGIARKVFRSFAK